MKYIKTTFLIAVLSLLLPVVSNALVNRDAVVDGQENFVRDSSGNCVRTQWQTNEDPCETRTSKYLRIEQMLERIIYFDFDKYNLSESEKSKLNALANALREENITAVKIVGYTDVIGTDSYNNNLSKKRAEAVKRYLGSVIRLNSSIVEVRALGKNNPVKVCDPHLKRTDLISCLAPNRRTEVEVDEERIEMQSE